MGLVGLSEGAKSVLLNILKELQRAPLGRNPLVMVVDEQNYGLLVELRTRELIDFVLEGTIPSEPLPEENEPFSKPKLYKVAILYRKYNDVICIDTRDNREIDYYLVGEWRQK